MQELIIAFIIWSMVGIAFVCLGIHAFVTKKTVGFWANAKTFEVKDVKKYNRAVGKLFCVYGIVFIILGVPILNGQNSAFALLSCAGILIETITVMIVYVTVIEKKYRKSERSYR